MTDLIEELKIIAKDGGRLTNADRELISLAAGELADARAQIEMSDRMILAANCQAIELRKQLDAMRVRFPEFRSGDNRQAGWSISTGWIAGTINPGFGAK